jgi:hypothetical protein
LQLAGGGGAAEVTSEVVYLAISLRNAGSGIAVLHGWRFYPERQVNAEKPPTEDSFIRLTRDLYIPVGDTGFWQGAFRDPTNPEFITARDVIAAHAPLTIDILYGDLEGGQRVITRFVLEPRQDRRFIASVSRHWNVDRPDPR